MAKWRMSDDMPQELRDLLTKVRKRKEAGEAGRRPHIDRWNTYYGLYRNYRKLVASRPDRDQLDDVRRDWGAELFIPYCFATIETVLPRILGTNPRMEVRPGADSARTATQPISKLFEQRQNEIDYALKLQPVVRRGLKYGLGVGKTYWDRDSRKRKRYDPRIFGRGYTEKQFTEVHSEGPQFEDVDIFDFFWDANARSIETCEWVIHRTFRSHDYVKRMLEGGSWDKRLDPEIIEGLGSESGKFDLVRDRMEAAGYNDFNTRQGRLHQVWEYHDCEEVVTVLDNAFVVERKPQYFHYELPFQIYRPTLQEGEFVGIGEIEPIAHLQYELNTLRSQRRDNATLVLQKAFMYTEGRVEPENLIIAPGEGIPVFGNPRDVISPIDIGEIPASGYNEEEALKADIERTVGVSDSVAGGGPGQAETATGIQLIQSAATVRIQQKAKNLEAELITPGARQWLWLYRQFTFGERPIRVEDASTPGGYRFEQVGTEQLNMDVEVTPVAGSTEPENVPQERNDAMVLMNQFNGNESIDQAKLHNYVLERFGISNPETWIVPDDPRVDPNVLGELLVSQVGIPEDQALQIVQAALQASGSVKPGVDAQRPSSPVQESPVEGEQTEE